jgi:hypothetical protein
MSRKGLSKSRLLSSLQCQKRLWLEMNRPELAEVSEGTEARFQTGHRVGEVARDLVAGGTLIEWTDDLTSALRHTKKALQELPATLFEAAFQHEGVLVRADVLRASRQGLRVNEVKSSTSVKDYHHHDAAIQAWVIGGAGYDVRSIAIQHIDNAFVYRGDGDYRGLFTEQSLGREIAPVVDQVPSWVAAARRTLAGKEPRVVTGKQCGQPFECAFQTYCASKEPQTEYPVSILPYGGKTVPALLAEGYRDLRDIPHGRLISENHQRVWRASRSGKPEFDQAGAARCMAAHGYPRHFLDFETVSFAVPIWAGTRPYQALPFQYSCHVQTRDGSVQWKAFLDLSGAPPMARFLESLLGAVGDKGPIFAWHANFEAHRLRDLAMMYPAKQEKIAKVIARIVDLLPIVRTHYYHPAMMGSWSLKAVLPTIEPGMAYVGVGEVQEGSAAELAYVEATSAATTPERKAALSDALTAYCRRDTEALVRIARFLESGR